MHPEIIRRLAEERRREMTAAGRSAPRRAARRTARRWRLGALAPWLARRAAPPPA